MLYVFPNISFCQKENAIWYFGGNQGDMIQVGAGIDFNSGSPVTLTNSAMPFTEGSAVQCDRNGNLMFYTNGQTIWNKSHSVMQNGTGLCGHWSSQQSAIIIPFPSDTSLYYVFSNAGYPTGGGGGLYYSVINSTLNGGLGAVTNTKCVSLLPSTGEGFAATWHSNTNDYWVVVSQNSTSVLFSFHISALGISPPVLSNLNINNKWCWKIDFNNKGNMLTLLSEKNVAGVSTARYISYFNQNTGLISTPFYVDTTIGFSGACFSTDDNLIYYYGGPTNLTLYQCDLNAPDIPASKLQIKQFSSGIFPYLDMKLGPDGKIYCNKSFSADSIDRINFPNILGVGCAYESNAIYLGGKKSGNLFSSKTFGKNIKPTGLIYITKSNSLKSFVHPNPNNGSFVLKLKDSKHQEFEISIYDVAGKQIYFEMKKETMHEIKLNYNLVNGFYFVKIKFEDGTVDVHRLIISN